MRRLTPLLASVLLSACGSSVTTSAPDLGSLTQTACGFPLGAGQVEGQSVACGTLDVPADYQDPSKGDYHLHVAYFRSSTASANALPVILLLGGPGDTIAAYGSAFTSQLFDALGHDVIVFDQRGAGQSDPAPECPAVGSLLDDPTTVAANMASCAATLTTQGVNLATFDTLASAEDVARLRQALGLSRYALVGWSYGTRLALQTLRAHPDGIAAFVIDSVTTPDQTPPDTKAPLVNAALTSLIQACQKDVSCNAAHPNLEQKIAETSTALPVAWSLGPKGSLTPTTYAALLMQIMARSTQPLDDAPSYIDEMDAFVTKHLPLPSADANSLAAALQAADLPSSAMYYSITCSDDQTADPTTAQASLANVRPALASFFKQANAVIFDGCAKWPYAKHPASAFADVHSSVPSLVLTARFDTLATASWADHAASTLSRSTTVRFTNAAHIVTATEPTGCALSILKAFLDSPSSHLDTSCAN